MDKHTPKVLVIVPAFNEEHSISLVVRRIREAYPSAHILVVNDGSSDRTRAEAEATGARVINLPFNLGIGGAVQTGFKIAATEGFDIAVQIDGDAQHDPKFLKDLIAHVIDGKLDMCIGSRFLEDKSLFRSTFVRRWGIRLFRGLLRILTGIPLTDPTSGFRAVNKSLIDLFAKDYPVDFPEPETIKIASRHRARIGEVPVRMFKRLGGRSSIRYLSAAYYMVKVTFSILIDALREKK